MTAAHGAGECRSRPATRIFKAESRSRRRGTPSRRGTSPRPASTSRRRATTSTLRSTTLATQGRGVSLALANERRDNAVAAADIALKRATVNKARDAQLDAQRTLAEAPPDTSPSELAALQAAVRQAGDDVTVAQEDLNASDRVRRRDARGRPQCGGGCEGRPGQGPEGTADGAPPGGARRAAAARAHDTRTTPPFRSLSATPRSRRQTALPRDVARLARKMGIQVPADEILFFSTLPLRVDSVRVRRGDTVTGRVMTVSNSRLAIDSSLSPNDAKLVRPGATVKIEEPDLGVKRRAS